MGYYLRFIVTGRNVPTLDTIATALREADAKYRFEGEDLYYGDDLYGEVEVNRPGDGTLEEEIEELVAEIEDSDEPEAERVIEALRAAKAIVAMRVLWQGRETEDTLTKLDPLWEWLHENAGGLLQADSEGYYDSEGLILEAT